MCTADTSWASSRSSYSAFDSTAESGTVFSNTFRTLVPTRAAAPGLRYDAYARADAPTTEAPTTAVPNTER